MITESLFSFCFEQQVSPQHFNNGDFVLYFYFLFCNGVCSTPGNISRMQLFNSYCLGSLIKFWFKFRASSARYHNWKVCLHVAVTTDVKWWNTIGAVTWQTAYENTVADALHSKKSSSALLVHEQQAPQKWCIPSNAKGKYMRTQAVCAKRLMLKETSVVTALCKQQHCWKLKTFNMSSFNI